jgi:hypothetical protein
VIVPAAAGAKGADMGLDFAIEELYATGWSALDSSGCKHQGGRAYPTQERVRREFAEAGFDLTIRHIQLFDTYRAEWRDAQGQARGGVIGKSEAEVAVYALSRLRRELAAAMA